MHPRRLIFTSISILIASALFLERVTPARGADSFIQCASRYLKAATGSKLDFERWLRQRKVESYFEMNKNISIEGAPGAVVAAPVSDSGNSYTYFWVRDGAIVMDTELKYLETLRPKTPLAERTLKKLKEWVTTSRKAQLSKSQHGLNQGKHSLQGDKIEQEWSDQSDGPARRAITGIHFAKFLAQKDPNYVRTVLYDGKWPDTQSFIKTDLEHILKYWNDNPNKPSEKTTDLWEEVYGYHFWTRMKHYGAMAEGADLAESLKDPAAASEYRATLPRIKGALDDHWDAEKRMFVATIQQQGHEYKTSGIDSSVIAALVEADGPHAPISVIDDRSLSTINRYESRFREEYAKLIADKRFSNAIPIGRYPEDKYTGGNPWPLLITYYSRFYALAARRFENKGSITISSTNKDFFRDLLARSPIQGKLTAGRIQSGDKFDSGSPEFGQLIEAIRDRGDDYLRVLRELTPETDKQSEQSDRVTGKPVGPERLTWNFASFLEALWARKP